MKLSIRFACLLLILSTALPVWGAKKTTNEQLVIGISQEFENLNPVIAQMMATYYIDHMARRPLTAVNTDWEYQCFLCTKIPTVANGLVKKIQEGGKEKLLVTWDLPPKAAWGDGTPLTGHDIKFSWEVGSAPEVTVGEKEVYTRVEAITVDPTNPKRFTMKFAEPRYDYYQMGTFYIIPKHIEEPIFKKTRGQVGVYEKQTTYVTNPTLPGLYHGPYLVKEVKLGSHVILEPNPHWYGEKPKIQKIIVRVIPNTQSLEANLRAGSIDMIGEVGLNFDQALAMQKRAKPIDSFEVRFRVGVQYEHIDLNMRNGVLKDAKVRKALLYGVDRDKLVRALFEGKQQVALHNIHPADVAFYSDKVVKYPYDPKKAEALLEEAGWKKKEDGYRYQGEKKLSLVLMTTAHDKTRELVEVFLQNEWKKIGIGIQIRNEPARVYFGETIRKGAYPHLAMYAWVASPDNPPLSTLHSKNIPGPKNNYNGQNTGAWANPEVDRLLDGLVEEFDAGKRKQMMRQILFHYTNDVPVLPLYYRAFIVAIPRNLDNFEITGHQFVSTYYVEKWNLK